MAGEVEDFSEEPAQIVDDIGKGCFGVLLTLIMFISIGVLGIGMVFLK